MVVLISSDSSEISLNLKEPRSVYTRYIPFWLSKFLVSITLACVCWGDCCLRGLLLGILGYCDDHYTVEGFHFLCYIFCLFFSRHFEAMLMRVFADFINNETLLFVASTHFWRSFIQIKKWISDFLIVKFLSNGWKFTNRQTKQKPDARNDWDALNS